MFYLTPSKPWSKNSTVSRLTCMHKCQVQNTTWSLNLRKSISHSHCSSDRCQALHVNQWEGLSLPISQTNGGHCHCCYAAAATSISQKRVWVAPKNPAGKKEIMSTSGWSLCALGAAEQSDWAASRVESLLFCWVARMMLTTKRKLKSRSLPCLLGATGRWAVLSSQSVEPSLLLLLTLAVQIQQRMDYKTGYWTQQKNFSGHLGLLQLNTPFFSPTATEKETPVQ